MKLSLFLVCVNFFYLTIGCNVSLAEDSLIVTPEGNVGIGTAAPTAKLEVDGDIKAHSISLLQPAQSVETGSVILWLTATPPEGYLECDGSEVSRTTYANLFGVVGVSFGDGDGATTFNLPDFRGYFLRGWDHGAGNDPNSSSRSDRGDGSSGDVVGSKQSDATARPNSAFRTDTKGSHSHGITIRGGTGEDGGGSIRRNDASGSSGTASSKSAGAHNHMITSGGDIETRPINISIMYCIKL